MTMQDTSAAKNGKSRREFLKTTVAGAAVAGGLSLARSAHAAGDDAIKIGMIGCGGRCTGAAANAMRAGTDVKLVAMCDLFDDRLQANRKGLGKMFPDQVMVNDDCCFTGLDGYQGVIDNCDVVLIACASKFHPMYMRVAIEAGKHVFVEKPHAIDPPGVRQVVEACKLAEEKGLSVQSGLQSRYHAGWRETFKRIHDGAIGDIVAIQSMFLRAPYVLRTRRPDITELQYQFDNWYHFRWLSGDDVPQSLVHNVDRVSWLMHEEMPLQAFGLAGRSSSFGELYGDMFDHHTVVYEYASGTRLYALCRTQAGCYNNARDVIMGSKGICHLGRCKIEGETNWTFEGPHNNPYDAEQKAFIESIRSGEPINAGSYMANSTMIGVMGQITCYTGKMTKWQDAYDANIQYGPKPEDVSYDMDPPSVPDETGNYPLPKPGLTKLG